jgi:hypothetical protein
MTTLKYFREEYDSHIAREGCSAGVCAGATRGAHEEVSK